MSKYVLLVAVALGMASCASEPVSSAQTNNTHIAVDYLFTQDGCRMYRFNDAGYPRYFLTCGGGVTMADERHQTGKTSVSYQVTIPTGQARP